MINQNGTLNVFKRVLKTPFKLQSSNKRKEDKARVSVLKEFRKVDPCLVVNFIAKIQTILTHESFVSDAVTGYIRGILGGTIPVKDLSVAPFNSRIQLHQESTTVGTLRDYSLYDYEKNAVNSQIILFNPDLKDIVMQLVDVRLNNLDLSMMEAMQIVISDVKEKYQQR